MAEQTLSPDACRLLSTLRQYPGWLSFRRDRRTAAAVRTLAYLGLAQVNTFAQIRATDKYGDPFSGIRGEAGAPVPQSSAWSVVKAEAAARR